jgi:hypothetical protein
VGFSSTSECAPVASGRHKRGTEAPLDGSSLEVSAPTAYPHAALQLAVSGLPRPTRLTPTGFLNLWTLHRFRVCWPYFRPGPLLGFALQSFVPHTQPYAVSDAHTLMSLGQCTSDHKPHRRKRQHGHKKQKLDARTLAFRVLLHVRVRHKPKAV